MQKGAQVKETYYYMKSCPCRIAVLADFHNGGPELIIASLKRQLPKIIAIPGDIVNGFPPKNGTVLENFKNILPLLEACGQIAPTFISLGNHDRYLHPEDIKQIEQYGCTVLDNAWIKWGEIIIGGLSSAYATYYQENRAAYFPSERYPEIKGKPPQEPRLSWMENYLSTPGYHILLCHHPEYYPLLPPVDLILSGHAHGGQWNLFGRGVYSSSQGLWPKYYAGIYHDRMVVSRGLTNTHKWIPRFGNPTELVYIQP